MRLNDGRADFRGDFWIGSTKNNVRPDGAAGRVGAGQGKLYRVAAHAATTGLNGIGIANTQCWSPDRTRFYFADTLTNTIQVFDYDAQSGAIGNARPFFVGFERGLPDGSGIDDNGYLWNCRCKGRCVVRIAPHGTVDRVVDMPVVHVPTDAFGGADLNILFGTTASAGRWSHRLTGSLFSIVPGCRGRPENVARV